MATKVLCPLCGGAIRSGRVLLDQDGKTAGVFCSRECAEEEAYGPQFRTYTIRRVASGDPVPVGA